jgi:hypothetical protein
MIRYAYRQRSEASKDCLMDPTTLVILGCLVLAIVAAALWALNRSWGDFPDRAGTLPSAGSSAPGVSPAPARPYSLDAALAAPEQGAPADGATPPSGLVPIENPMVLRAAEAALDRGGQAARYIVRDGERLYFAFDQISDPTQRQAAYDLMRRFNAGEDVDLRAMMQLVRQMFNS